MLRIICAKVKFRLFVAVELDDATRRFVSRQMERLAELGVAGRWEAVEKLHVTVAFLGPVEEARLDEVGNALREATQDRAPFALRFERAGVFPNARRPRVLWLGPDRESAAFTACAKAVREAYESLGFSFDHDPHAHITICRPREVPPGAIGTLPQRATQEVRGVCLMRSLPAGPTTRYEALERTSLAEGQI